MLYFYCDERFPQVDVNRWIKNIYNYNPYQCSIYGFTLNLTLNFFTIMLQMDVKLRSCTDFACFWMQVSIALSIDYIWKGTYHTRLLSYISFTLKFVPKTSLAV